MLTHDLRLASQYGTQITRGEIVCDNGKPCILIALLDSLDPPVQNPGQVIPYDGSGRRVWIDEETGEQVKTQAFWQLQDGAEFVESTSNVMLVEKVDSPPQEILDILDKVVVP
jgi:hypothetical protein